METASRTVARSGPPPRTVTEFAGNAPQIAEDRKRESRRTGVESRAVGGNAAIFDDTLKPAAPTVRASLYSRIAEESRRFVATH
ncbi:hypothetical protein [uncultured Victivallis sp.]|uniref:hypothetical protein n=1 Tax=uncultured Victivallis sp. TaxID=354118 RepID=UPI0025D9C99F|nr:hypothetical protein [uncultured Victivallis sp.]